MPIDFLTVKNNLTITCIIQTNNGTTDSSFTTTRLTNEGKGFTLVDEKISIVDSNEFLASFTEGNLNIF